MAKEVILTPIALKDLEIVTDYLMLHWGTTVINNFIERFEKVIVLLSENPSLFPFHNQNKRMQRCVVTKHNILYFIEMKFEIKVITVFDTRQSPEKLNVII